MSKHPPPAFSASAGGPCSTIIQTLGRPGTGSLPRTIAPPDHPQQLVKRYTLRLPIWEPGARVSLRIHRRLAAAIPFIFFYVVPGHNDRVFYFLNFLYTFTKTSFLMMMLITTAGLHFAWNMCCVIDVFMWKLFELFSYAIFGPRWTDG